MTLEERVDAIIDEFPLGVAHHRHKMAIIIRRALIEQDKITRHACAETVITEPEYPDIKQFGVEMVSTLNEVGRMDSEYVAGLISHTVLATCKDTKNSIHAAVMNCRGGVK